MVEDEPATALAVSRLMKRNGWETVVTSTLTEALRALRSESPDVVLLDYHLSDGLGWPVLEKANTTHPPIPVIVLTGAGDETIASRALRSGAADYLVKRGNYLTELPRSVTRVLEVVQMKRNILELEERQMRLLASLPVMVALVEACGSIAFVNHAWRELIRWLRSQAVNDSTAPEHPLQFPPVQEGLARIQGGGLQRFEARYRYRYSGVERYFKVLVSPVAGSDAVLTLLDITEEVLKEHEIARLAGVIEQSQDLIVITTSDWLIDYVNPAFEAIYGQQLPDLKGRPVKELYDERNDPRIFQEIAARIAADKPWSGRLEHLVAEGDLRYLDASIAIVRIRDGEIVHHVMVLRDVTRQVHLEKQLLQAQKMEAVGRLAGGIAHDFNNLLTVISGSATFLQSELEPRSSAQADLKDILAATDSAAALTRQLLSFARLQVVQPKPLDLNGQLQTLTNLLNRILKENVEVRLELHPGVLTIQADPYQVEQALLNLAVNASDAMPDGGVLTVSTKLLNVGSEEGDLAPGRYACLCVADTGIGITEENLKQIFEPFFTTKPVGQGTGLGLSSVYGIAQQHSGGVRVHSNLGRGTEFRILFPYHTPEAEGDQPSGPESSAKGRLATSIFVIEDNHGVRRIVVRSLERRGYHVSSFESAEEVLALSKESLLAVDLFLSDVILPGLAGPELARQLRERRVNTPFIFMSGYSEPGEVKDALALGSAYIKKPFTTNELLQAIVEVLQLDSPDHLD